mmetsp:Transcript_104231/g.185183  ORF Transcript_104231/g.185183 Transcript_104231/m.185183 type:complete len:386 (-) Transcript_104231:255-1412(-)|eukprot:CAMPEP_0197663210 /NCGR_PEP_ID=MMETSP1338-20131121/56544_1 /TAXON_ID=43686 ORGANISM="Pelagodinium beii, Strain RCC1491" /NCGR_SAMPLE_ID=MMETSP1338 /ASSEMBLY_ACC=CAM_ASM_000754 /LENGTH=385 /DNA_ID=CAMNT_0043241469 /DNA_START=87 /DNA_END=1244 /DNA_ORIENTATION=+
MVSLPTLIAWSLLPCAWSSSECPERATEFVEADAWAKTAEMYEYSSNANPPMSEIPVRVFPPSLHQSGPSRVIPFDISKELQVDYPATCPNLLANFVRILEGERLDTGLELAATSQAFYIIRGKGKSRTRVGEIEWEAGDFFVLPYLGDVAEPVCATGGQCVAHTCASEDSYGGCAIYWVHDEPLLQYLGVKPSGKRRFEPTLYRGADMRATVANITNVDEDGSVKNRHGILLGNTATPQTKTLTPTLWSLLNVIGAQSNQRPHKHNSVALDFAVVGGKNGTVFTKMGRELDNDGNIVNPVIAEWSTGGVFITPPGWWHSHHNLGDMDAWVLPVQDAGVYTHQRTLDIRFADEEASRVRSGRSRGATLDPETTKATANLYSSGAM